jgi:hypothetical protein
MSTPITIDAADVTAAANFLEEFLSDEVPAGDFTTGTAMRDLTINALAAVVAFMRADSTQVRQMQSLLTVQAATGGDEEALRDGVTAILSNLLVVPKGGGKGRGFAVGHATQQVDVFIPTTIRFTYSQGVLFVVDSSDTYFVPAAEMVPVVEADGSIVDYEFRIPLVAVATGESYNVDPALFASFDRFSPYVTHVESTVKFSGGRGPETVTEILARAPTAVATRNLINDRSIPAVLDDNFDGIESVLVVGMGEPEMQRDIVPTVAANLRFHVGGAVDIYLRTALVETTFTGNVGAFFARPDGIATMFHDSMVTFASVQPGDILRVTAGLPIVPAEFMVMEIVGGSTIIISENAPFPIATDEALPPTTVNYTIGRIGPVYNDVVADTGGVPYTSGVTSRSSATTGRITLPGGPVMDFLDVAILNPPGPESSFKSPLDGFVHFPNQVNTTPSEAATPSEGLQFQTIVHNSALAQSAKQWMEVVVGTDSNAGRFDGYQLRVRYRTIASFDVIDAFVRGQRERVAAAYQLPRSHHPVVIRMTVTYRLKATATTLIDDDAVAQAIVDYVHAFDATSQAIDASTVITTVLTQFTSMANIVPSTPGGPLLTIYYDLRAPTGDVLSYATTDVVEVSADKQIDGPALNLDELGVTGRTLRYVTSLADITVQQEGAA